MKLILVIQNSVQQDYRPEMYSSYQNIPSFDVASLDRPGLDCPPPLPAPTPESLWKTLGMRETPTQQPKVCSFSPIRKNPNRFTKSCPTAKNLFIFPNRKIPLNIYTSFTIKSTIPSPIK